MKEQGTNTKHLDQVCQLTKELLASYPNRKTFLTVDWYFGLNYKTLKLSKNVFLLSSLLYDCIVNKQVIFGESFIFYFVLDLISSKEFFSARLMFLLFELPSLVSSGLVQLKCYFVCKAIKYHATCV